MSTLRGARSRLNFSSSSRTEAREPSDEQDFYLEPDPLMSGSEGFPPADAPVTKGLAPPTHSGASGANNEASAMPTFSVPQEIKLNNPNPPIIDGSSEILSTAEDENESPDHPDPQLHPQDRKHLPGGASRDTNHPNQQRNILPGSPSIPPSAAAAAAGAIASEVAEEAPPSRSSLGGLQTFSLRLSMHLEGNTVILESQLSEVSQTLSAQKRNPLMALRQKLPPEKNRKVPQKPPCKTRLADFELGG